LESPSAASGTPYRLPPLSLLEAVPPESQREIRSDLHEIGRTLVETLAEFGIETQLTNVEQGPVVTRFELLPAPGVRVERIAGLSNNIALALKAESVRVQAPIPGKGVVGIEVPNIKTTLVYLREVLESDTWRRYDAALPLAIGKDVGGRVIVSDLTDMPHLLIAGATGSGKTICMNALLLGLLMSRTPEELRLLLVDPKIVEFSAYNQLPHLVAPVITDPKKVALGLRWAIAEMEKRYKLFARVGVRNIKAFNARPIERQAELFPTESPASEETDANAIPTRLPYILIVVDELADLMLVAQADIENSIARLAQLSRAVGIHMVLATQRPSVNVITGTIKANFPARIAFQVAQKVDSRTILDANGADKLLGKGDMLFLPPGTSKMIRAQGCMVSDTEVRSVVEFIRSQSEPRFETAIREKLDKKTPELPEMEEDDTLIEQAIEIIRQTQRASTSSLQRRLRIGYTRAARIMDLLEERGIVGPAQGSDPREILIDLSGEIPKNEDTGT
jgi:S-DNA-T family DNA segregation ATPase FtsK/SpoIIIE